MRKLLKSAGFVLYFLIAQCLATVGFIVYKIYADKEWMNALCNTLETSGAISTEYVKLIVRYACLCWLSQISSLLFR